MRTLARNWDARAYIMPPDHFLQLLEINRARFESGHFDTAFHALAAALHCAEDECDAARAARVGDIANSQAKHIDEQVPEYRHSARSAVQRGNCKNGIFTTLSRQAAAQVTIIHSAKK